jgi:hypothetical protein
MGLQVETVVPRPVRGRRQRASPRARITQVMNLLLLAPDIQEKILINRGTGPYGIISERQIRAALKNVEWDRQRSALESS